MKKIKKSIVLIDGSNLYFKLKDLQLHDILSLDLKRFCSSITSGTKLEKTTYYIGKIRTDGSKKSQAMFDKQRKLLAHLRKNGIDYSLGYLLKSNDAYHEKGVDVKMAVDIVVAAYENVCSEIFVISSDTDLIPAIEIAQNKSCKIHYVGFKHKPSYALLNNCNKHTLLTKEYLSKFRVATE